MILKEKTIYIGHDDIEYEAIAEFETETNTIIRYDYLDSDDNWVNTEERNWCEDDIQNTFFNKDFNDRTIL